MTEAGNLYPLFLWQTRSNAGIILGMAVIRISEADATRNFTGILARAIGGD